MNSPEIQVLIPCHSLEDFPTEQTDQPAASLLNSFAVAFHPILLAWTKEFPRWNRADDPPLPRRGQLIIIPTVSDSWLPYQWVENARATGAVVVSGLSDRTEMIDAALKVTENKLDSDAPSPTDGPSGTSPLSNENSSENRSADEVIPDELPDVPCVQPELVKDFLSLGTCWLIIELLTRRMRQFGNIDETRFFQKVQAAAKAALADDSETVTMHLQTCFEMLLEARERFYPVDCYLLDLCLAMPDVDQDQLLLELKQPVPFSLLATTNDLSEICQKIPELQSELISAGQSGQVSIVGGEDRETVLSLLPLESVLYHFRRGRTNLNELLSKVPTVWGRRHFALSAVLPQLLVKFGFQAALHVVLDDGIYPDAEYTKLRWRGVDGTLIDALSRIPLAADSAASYLRFSTRMAESMDHDQVAGLILARWPALSSPWFDDLRRSQKYAPCLGRFVTLDRFFEQTELPGQLSTYKPEEYFSPILIQHVARREKDPISRYADHTLRRHRLDAATWCHSAAKALITQPITPSNWQDAEDRLELTSPSEDACSTNELTEQLAALEESGTAELSRIIMNGAAPGRGTLVINTLSSTRRIPIPLSNRTAPPAIGGVVKAVDFDPAHPETMACVVEVPGCGYSWIPSESANSLPPTPRLALAEPWLLRNDLFEVAINVRTGGIGHVRFHQQRAKRMSQQLSFRFPRERTIRTGPESGDFIKSQYAEMRCLGHEVVRNGTACGEIVTWGELFDQAQNQVLAKFRQTTRVWRGTPTIEIEIELSDVKAIDGDPWNNYFASRFAWDDSTSVLTRSINHSAHAFAGERFETSDYIEVASDDERLTIVPHGLPFHRKTGERMVDSLLIVAGETKRQFRFTVEIDATYPLEAAWNATTPPLIINTEKGLPRSGLTGWFFRVDARHIQISRILPVDNPTRVVSSLEQFEHSTVPTDPGFALRLIETEGRSRTARLVCFRKPTYARKRDFRGETVSELAIDGDAVLVDLTAYEIVDVELRFGAK